MRALCFVWLEHVPHYLTDRGGARATEGGSLGFRPVGRVFFRSDEPNPTRTNSTY